MDLFGRSDRGSLKMNTLELQIFFGELFEIAKDEDEVEWILENLQGVIEVASDERIEILEDQQ